jgi:hypothetical protein
MVVLICILGVAVARCSKSSCFRGPSLGAWYWYCGLGRHTYLASASRPSRPRVSEVLAHRLRLVPFSQSQDGLLGLRVGSMVLWMVNSSQTPNLPFCVILLVLSLLADLRPFLLS